MQICLKRFRRSQRALSTHYVIGVYPASTPRGHSGYRGGVIRQCAGLLPEEGRYEWSHPRRSAETNREEAESYRAQREAALSDFAANLAKERAMLDEAERAQGEQLREEIRQGRATLDRAEREFFEQVEEARRDFDAAIEEARRSIG